MKFESESCVKSIYVYNSNNKINARKLVDSVEIQNEKQDDEIIDTDEHHTRMRN